MELKKLNQLMKLGLPFAGVPFRQHRRAEVEAPTNGERADAGKTALALSCYEPGEVICAPSAHVTTGLLAMGINLTEAPDEALSDLLTNLMHYCHREGINFGDVLATAAAHFDEESGGALV